MTDERPADGARVIAGFNRIVFKRLSAVETDVRRSNQHEFNGTLALREAFGSDPRRIMADFVWMPDDGDWLSARDELTWYDARARHPVRSEYRLYYRSNPVTRRAASGDILLIGLRDDGTALALVASGSGLAAARIFWLFGIEVAPGSGFAAVYLDPSKQQELARRLGIAREATADEWSIEDTMVASAGDYRFRQDAARAQAAIGGAPSRLRNTAAWVPDDAPDALGGDRLGRTIRGIIEAGRFR